MNPVSTKRLWMYLRTGTVGNKVIVFPDIGTVVVVTSTNQTLRNAHQLTAQVIDEYVLSAMEP